MVGVGDGVGNFFVENERWRDAIRLGCWCFDDGITVYHDAATVDAA